MMRTLSGSGWPPVSREFSYCCCLFGGRAGTVNSPIAKSRGGLRSIRPIERIRMAMNDTIPQTIRMIQLNQHAGLAIAAGLALILLLVISYFAVWQPRVNRENWVTQQSSWREVFSSIPWIIILIIAGLAITMVHMVTHYAAHPPNW